MLINMAVLAREVIVRYRINHYRLFGLLAYLLKYLSINY